jgi:tRNA (guanine37-N1)-methyltransferase
MKCLCAIVPRAEGEKVRKKLSEAGLLRLDARITSDGQHVFIPVTGGDGHHPVKEMEMEEVVLPKSYQDILNLPPGLMELLPTSFDIVGDIFVLKLIDEILPYAKDIANALLETNRNAKVVVLDRGVKGEFRTRDLELLAGENRTTTVQKEYGLRFEMDLAKVYFSPRLATERKRIADLIVPGEIILDMFCGVGPFSLMLASTKKPGSIYAIDLNPEAIKYMLENIKLNKIKSISPMLGNARDIAPTLPRPDRIIMNLPHTAIDFLDVALKLLNPRGMIHLYIIIEEESLELIKRSIAHLAVSIGRGISFKNIHEVHTYSPTQSLFCFDLLIG